MRVKLTGVRIGTLLIDKEDYYIVEDRKWRIDIDGYVYNNGKMLSRIITKCPKGMVVDHINHNKLDNRKSNLRIVENSVNSTNQPKHKNSSSIYYGVSYNKQTNNYKGRVIIDGGAINIGTYSVELDAAKAYDYYLLTTDQVGIKPLNFPNDTTETLSIQRIKNKIPKIIDYNGVYKSRDMYITIIQINNKRIEILRDFNLKKCASAYDDYIVSNNIYGKSLNFPEKYPEFNPNPPIRTLCEYYDKKSVKLLLYNKNVLALIDKEDYEKIKYYKCYINNSGYVLMRINNSKNYILHRFLFDEKDLIEGYEVDHADKNKANNCRSNLRIITKERNKHNKSKKLNAKSIYIGVCSKGTSWSSQLNFNKKNIYLGTHTIEEYAGRHRDLYILINLKDECYTLNFEWTNDDIIKWKTLINTKYLI